VYQDYQHVLDREDVDAVIVATPGPLARGDVHASPEKRARLSIMRSRSPITIQESQTLVAAVKSAGLPFLVGTHQRNMWSCRTARELIRNGRIGKVAKATVVLFNKGWRGGPFATQPVPEGLDLGSAGWGRRRRLPTVPSAARSFHGWWDYGGGEMLNWGATTWISRCGAMDLGRSFPVQGVRVC